jgi:hypothetical protein
VHPLAMEVTRFRRSMLDEMALKRVCCRELIPALATRVLLKTQDKFRGWVLGTEFATG